MARVKVTVKQEGKDEPTDFLLFGCSSILVDGQVKHFAFLAPVRGGKDIIVVPIEQVSFRKVE